MADETTGSVQMDLDDIEVREESHDHAAPCARPSCLAPQNPPQVARVHPPASTTAKNRRRRYLDTHPEYFGSNLELSDPLLYDRLVRRWQTAAERQDAGRSRDYGEVLEAGFMRAELRMEEVRRDKTRRELIPPQDRGNAASRDGLAETRVESHPGIDIFDEEAEQELDPVQTREQAWELWKETMSSRFVSGRDALFERYEAVDNDEDLDQIKWNDDEEVWFEAEDPKWIGDESEDHDGGVNIERLLHGETGVQDF